jgi:hypothetical protein
LLSWISSTLSSQRDEGPLEDLPALLEQAHRPRLAVITIGATRYTDFGERTFVRAGDRTAIAVYDPERVAGNDLVGLFGRCKDEPTARRPCTEALSLLVREVVQG